MVRSDWVSIGIPKGLASQLDNFIKSEEGKKFGVTNRQQLISLVMRKFLETGPNIFEKVREVEDLKIKLNTSENMLGMVGKGLMGVNDMENLKIIKADSKKTILKDKAIKKNIEITRENEVSFCSFHKAAWCNHIAYIFYIAMMIGLENAVEKYQKK